MPNLRCERFGPFDIEELKEELGNLEFEYMMDLAPSKPPTVVRLCECKDEDYEGYHIRLFVGDYEYCVEEGNEAEDVKEMLETMSYETYAEQDLEGIPRFHNWYMALPGKSPYDPTYIEECKIRADAFFKEKEERKKLEEAAASAKAAEQVRIIAGVLSKTALRSLSPPPHTPPPSTLPVSTGRRRQAVVGHPRGRARRRRPLPRPGHPEGRHGGQALGEQGRPVDVRYGGQDPGLLVSRPMRAGPPGEA